MSLGGQAIFAEIIENYPGFPHSTKEPELMQKIEEQAVRFGLRIEYGEVVKVEVKKDEEDKINIVKTDNQEYKTLAVIVVSGAETSGLGVPGEEELRGKGVSYCATCDASLFQNQKIVVGGGDTAIEEALYLTKFAQEITIGNMMSSQEDIYACGDVRKKILRQVVTACGEGAIVAFAAEKYIEELKGVSYK